MFDSATRFSACGYAPRWEYLATKRNISLVLTLIFLIGFFSYFLLDWSERKYSISWLKIKPKIRLIFLRKILLSIGLSRLLTAMSQSVTYKMLSTSWQAKNVRHAIFNHQFNSLKMCLRVMRSSSLFSLLSFIWFGNVYLGDRNYRWKMSTE